MINVAILTISDSAVEGTRPDRSGPKLRERVESLGWTIAAQELVPDEADQIATTLRRLADTGLASVIERGLETDAAAVRERPVGVLQKLVNADGRKRFMANFHSSSCPWRPRPAISVPLSLRHRITGAGKVPTQQRRFQHPSSPQPRTRERCVRTEITPLHRVKTQSA